MRNLKNTTIEEEIPEQKEEKVWCDCCRVEVWKQGWQDHINSYKHKHYSKLEASEVLEAQGKIWCDTCRVLISRKAFSQEKLISQTA